MVSISNSYKTEKASSLIHLNNIGANVPETVLSNSMDFISIAEFKKNLSKINSSSPIIVRICYSDIEYPHYLNKISSKDAFMTDMKELLSLAEKNSIKEYDIIVSSLIENIKVSGAIIKRNDSLLLELVRGMPVALFRNGQVCERILATNDLMYTQKYYQKSCVSFINGSFVEHPSSMSVYDNKEIVDSAIKCNLENGYLYEFGVADGVLYLFEGKKLHDKAFASLNKIFDKSIYFVNNTFEIETCNTIHYQSPLFDYIKFIKNNSNYVFSSGAIASHLSIHMAKLNINVAFEMNNGKVLDRYVLPL